MKPFVSRVRAAFSICASLAVLLGTVGTSPSHAQSAGDGAGTPEPPVPEKAGKSLRAFRITGDPPQVDGHLDEEVWAVADSIDDLVQWEPDNMAPLSERTVIQIVYDDRYIYVGVRCYDGEPSEVAAGLGRRDNFPPTDLIEIGFDPRHDHLTAFFFQTNPSGVQGDFSFFDDDNYDGDYDAVWEVAAQMSGEGWAAEFRIPFSQMRFDLPRDNEIVWGFNVQRTIQRKGENGHWVGRPRGEPGAVSRWGHLVFADRLSTPRRFELLPFGATRRVETGTAPGAELTATAGVDLRLGLGTSATLSATINPDFGQVESDPAVLNLSVFETFFPERRPFFLEDSRTFVPPYFLFQLFHSRRIGQPPGRLPLGAADRLVDRPDRTTILGAVKVTGKNSGWTYGGLTALTSREYATVNSLGPAGPSTETLTGLERLIEPLTSYSVARVQRDILGGSSNVGGIVTSVMRERDDDAFTGGIDYNIRWGRNHFEWNGHWAATRAPGEGGVRTGGGGVTNFNYTAKHLFLFSHFDHFGRDFRVNDLGFQQNRNDRTAFNAGFCLEQPDPWWHFRSVSFCPQSGQAWNGDRLVFERFIGSDFSMQFRNFWGIGGGVWHNFRVLDDLDTRGGPPIVSPASTFVNLWLDTDSRKSSQLMLNLSGWEDEEGGWDVNIGPSVRLQPSTQLQTSVGVNYNFGRDAAQWITNRERAGGTDYVYGTLRRDVLDVTLRATYAVHRDLTLEVFLQPFVAVGDYSDIRKLARPSSFEFEPTTLLFDPDFNDKSLRGNIVLRWEYVRGSTLFLVWNLASFDERRPGIFTPLRDLGDTFGADGINAFIVKVNYWIDL